MAVLVNGCGDDTDDDFAGEFSEADQVSDEVCDPQLVGDDEGPVEAIYALEDGRLAGLCWGDPDEAVTGAFELLELVVGHGPLADLAFIGGFDGGGDTLAFVTPVDDDYTAFVMAIDTVSAVDDPAELRLTLLHEFAHVFTQTGDQLDVAADPDACATFWNGAGCFVPGSYLDSWINEFWSDEELRTLPVDGSADEEGGVDRCAVDAGFLGAYAASSPEEDFAETFSAFVFDLDVAPGVEPRLDFFERYPELVDARDSAAAEAVTDVPNNFDLCG
jgi:hypothetical protein